MVATRLITCMMALASFASVGWIYPALPARVPTHFNFHFEPDRFGPKGVVWLLPALVLFAGVIVPLAKAWMLRGLRDRAAEGRDAAVGGLVACIFLAVSTYTLSYSAPPPQQIVVGLGAIVALAGAVAFVMSRRLVPSDAALLAWPLCVGTGLGLISAGLIGCTLPFALAFLVVVIAIYGGLSIWSERTTVAWR